MATLATFDREYTCATQKALCVKQNVKLTIDGDFGAKSVAVLKSYQQANGLAITGMYDAATRASIEPFMLSKFLTTPDYQAAVKELGISLPVIKAFQETEVAGMGFLPSGKPKILFERHWFSAFLKKANPSGYSQLAAANPDIISDVPGGYIGDEGEWSRFNRAFAIDAQSAMLSASWGLFQIMGFNFADAGYKDVGAMVDDMKVSEMMHLKAFTQFAKTYRQGQLWGAMRSRDWAMTAKLYNGSGAVAEYSKKLKNWYDYFTNYYGTV